MTRNATIFGSVQFIMTSTFGPDVTRTFPSQLPLSCSFLLKQGNCIGILTIPEVTSEFPTWLTMILFVIYIADSVTIILISYRL